MKGEMLADDPIIGYAGWIMARGDRIWVVDYKGEPFVHILDTTTWKVLFSRGRSGMGPGDFQNVRAAYRVGHGSSDVWAYDAERFRLVRLTDDGRAIPGLGVTFGRTTQVHRITPLGSGWVGWSANADSAKRYVGFNEKGVVTFTAPGSLLGDASTSQRERLIASTNLSLCSHPSGDRFAVAYARAGRIEIRGAHAELIALAAVPDSSNGDFAMSRGGARIWDRGGPYYYVRCVGTDAYLFALFAGNPTTDARTGARLSDAPSARRIQVFDWSGQFIRTLTLDRGLTAIAISGDGRWLYGGDFASAAVYRFPLPVIPAGPRP